MKKITLLLFVLISSFTMKAQNEIFFDDFEDDTIPGWTFYDEDGDDRNWGDINVIDNQSGDGFLTPLSLISKSWASIALTPDNWAVSTAFDLSSASGEINIEYVTQVASQAFDEEKYSLYVSTTDDFTAIQDLRPIVTEVLGDDGDTGAPVTHNYDISAFAGEETVYIVFRHFDCTDQDYLAIDYVKVEAETLSNNEFESVELSHFYKAGQLTIQSSFNLDNVSLYNTLGQKVLTQDLNSDKASVNVSSLSTGLYIAKVASGDQVNTFKFVKQ
jgi:hypothetical protein